MAAYQSTRAERDTLHTGLVQALFTMRMRGGDRDNRTDCVPYDNFSEFYEHWSPLLVVRFDDERLLMAKAFETFVLRQLRPQLEAQDWPGSARDFDSVKSLVAATVQENLDDIITKLQAGDSRSALAAMLAKNKAPGLV